MSIEITDYIKPELLMLIPMLIFLGKVFNDTFHMDSTKIPLALGICGIVFAMVWVLATSKEGSLSNWRQIMLAVFTGVVQGLLCAAGAVYSNQLYKQSLRAKKNHDAKRHGN